jgi:hypothetical protein
MAPDMEETNEEACTCDGEFGPQRSNVRPSRRGPVPRAPCGSLPTARHERSIEQGGDGDRRPHRDKGEGRDDTGFASGQRAGISHYKAHSGKAGQIAVCTNPAWISAGPCTVRAGGAGEEEDDGNLEQGAKSWPRPQPPHFFLSRCSSASVLS